MTFTSYFESSTGFHPTYKICVLLEDDAHSTNKDCYLHVAITLPPDVLLDPYELENYHSAFTFRTTSATDLESPVFGVETRDSQVFLNVTLTNETRHNVCIDFPIHMRYGRLLNHSGYRNVIIPYPRVFWSCPGSYTPSTVIIS
jgi:PIG-X / PBN1